MVPPPLFLLVGNNQWQEAIGRAATHPEEVDWKNSNGLSVLHDACLLGAAPISVIIALIEASPAKKTTEFRCYKGCIPLHFACKSSRLDYVTALLEANSQTITWTDFNGNDALDWAASPVNQILNQANENRGTIIDQVAVARSEKMLSIVSHLLSCHASELRMQPSNPIQIISKIQQCPCTVAYMMCLLFPTCVEKRDDAGDLPLHVAIASKSVETAGRGVVSSLIEYNPDAARGRDFKNDRLPLHIAVIARKELDQGVRSILDAYPPALSVRDEKTKLFPFMLAACSTFADTGTEFESEAPPRGGEGEEDVAKTSMVYELLRALPELERFSLPESNDWVSDEPDDGIRRSGDELETRDVGFRHQR